MLIKHLERFKKYIPNKIIRLIKGIVYFFPLDRWSKRSWSQEGEDQILARIFEHQVGGFYVDVGAHHPQRFSNTYLFYKKGWQGINIDAMPGSMKYFRKLRSKDINIEIGVGRELGCVDYYVFNEPALNGFSKELSHLRNVDDSSFKIDTILKVNVIPLSSLLDKYLPEKQGIDFMSVDVEGLDLDVLMSNDWDRYRPKYVLAEVLGGSLHDIHQSEICRFMNKVDYVVYAKCVNTVFFKDAIS